MTDTAQPRRAMTEGRAISRPRRPLAALICQFAGHAASARTVRNGGNHFSRCTRCRIDLVQADDGAWAAPPSGYRIVWREASPKEDEVRQEPVAPSPPAAASEAPAETVEWPLRAGEPSERRQRVDRRRSQNSTLPHFLNGRDRRRSGDRRAGFGKRLVVRP